MADPRLRQTAGNACGSGQSRTVRVNFTESTQQGNLVVVWAVCAWGSAVLTGPEGFTLIRERSQGELKLAVWYREGAPSMSSVSVSTSVDRSLQVRALEYSGAAQSGALDKVTVLTSTDDRPRTGPSGTTTQPDSIVVAAIANRYASTTQFGFSGALSRLIDQVSPQNWGFLRSDPDDRRTRLTIHQAISSVALSFALSALLSAHRNWIAILCTFRGGSSGPARMTSLGLDDPMVETDGGTPDSLTVFGPLTSVELDDPMIDTSGPGVARIGPFDHQYLIGGWDGLLIGNDTEYRVSSHEGLEGWDVRTSDDELPRGDGALRGVDLQAARQILFQLNVSGSPSEVERKMDTLYRALVIQRDGDWDLIYRHPGRPLRMIRVRPTNLVRELTAEQVIVGRQAIALRAADPRHYSASEYRVSIPVTPAGADPLIKSVVNLGNGPAYPLIRISGPAFGEPVTRVELVNATNDVIFGVSAVLPTGATLVGDMEARATGANRSVVTIGGQTKYGAWQHPRLTWQLNPGGNNVYLRTTPAGAPVTAELIYRDTWSG